jgi:tRNA (guanosine-2'-O-)-methyltransferase
MKENLSDHRKKQLLDYLLGFISEHKKNLFEQVIRNRTRYLTVVVEDLYQPHNISAVLRSCDCFGIQDVHIIENKNRFEVNPDISLGSSKWLTISKYDSGKDSISNAVKFLRTHGYRIVAATPHDNNKLPDELQLESKTALIFGTELEGLSEIALKNADELIKIPMYGFTESFNISVSVALILFALSERLRKLNINWRLEESEIIDIKLDWVKNVIKRSELLEERFLKNL